MFSHIIGKSISDREFNEDVYSINPNLIFVIDGATGLGENNIMGKGDDAWWFVENVKSYLETHLNENETIENCLKKITNILYNQYKSNNVDLNKAFMPSSCISLFRIIDNQLEYYGLGDCVGVVELKNGSIEIFYDEKLVCLDQVALNAMVEISEKKGISPFQARREIQDILIKNRSLLNSEEGYYSLELMGQGIDKAMKKTWKIDDVKRIMCMSDGFYEIMDFQLFTNVFELMNAVALDFESVFKLLYDAQKEDRDGYKVPRFKLRDDTTMVYAEIGK